MLIIVSFYDNGLCEVMVQPASFKWLANCLEEKKLAYTVTISGGLVKQEHFGFGGYEYWVESLFNQEV